MRDSSAPNTSFELRITRANRDIDVSVPAVEKEVLASVARVLKEAEDNGVELKRSGNQLSSKDLRAMYRKLASAAWESGELAGESPPNPLHREHSGWELPLENEPGQLGREYKLPWPILAIDVIDFLSSMMGAVDELVWEEGAS